jgi:hypothetical protein
VPTNSFNNLAGSTRSAFAAFCGKSSEDVFPPSFRQHQVHRSDHLLHALRELLNVLAGRSVGPGVPQVRLDELSASMKPPSVFGKINASGEDFLCASLWQEGSLQDACLHSIFHRQSSLARPAASSAASSSPDFAWPSVEGNSSFTAACCLLPDREPSQPGYECCSATTGSSTPSGLSAVRNMYCAISVQH